MIKKQRDDKKQWFLYSANLRTKTLVIIAISIIVIVSIFVCGYFIRDIPSNFASANQMPSLEHLFGTDWMGRDMFQRTIAGLGLSSLIAPINLISSEGWEVVPAMVITYIIIPVAVSYILYIALKKAGRIHSGDMTVPQS